MYWNRMVWHVRLRSSTLLQAKNVVATWCGLHKVRTWASRSNQDDNCCRLWHREGPPSPPQPCPILHKQEATGNCRRLIRWISRNQIWPFLCPAQDSLVAKDRRKGLTQDSISKYYKESTSGSCSCAGFGSKDSFFQEAFCSGSVVGQVWTSKDDEPKVVTAKNPRHLLQPSCPLQRSKFWLQSVNFLTWEDDNNQRIQQLYMCEMLDKCCIHWDLVQRLGTWRMVVVQSCCFDWI